MSPTVEILMPHLQPGTHWGEMLCWFKRSGQLVRPGESIAEIREGNQTTIIRAFDHGILTEVLVQEGDQVSVGEVVARIHLNGHQLLPEEDGEGFSRSRHEEIIDLDWQGSPDREEPVPGLSEQERYPESFEW